MAQSEKGYKVEDTDMSPEFKKTAIDICLGALQFVSSKKQGKVATKVKHELGEKFPDYKWHCIVGKTFSCYFTHDEGTFMNIKIDEQVILIFSA